MNTAVQFSWKCPKLIDHEKYLHLVQEITQISEDYKKEQQQSLTVFFYLYFGMVLASGIKPVGLNVNVHSELSLGSGTGSSASFAVSLAGAFLRYLTIKLANISSAQPAQATDEFTRSELGLISEWAFSAEKIIHGNPSGIDNTVCTFGSMVSFRKGSDPVSIQSGRDIRGILVDSCVPKNTGEMVRKVARLKDRHPKVIENILESIEELSSEAVEYFSCLGLLEKTGAFDDVEQCYKNLSVSRVYFL